MKLKKLLKLIPELVVKGLKDIEILGMSSHSKSVKHGDLFVAKRGLTSDGAKFIPDAMAAGATSVLTETYNPTLKIPQLICAHIPDVEAKVAGAIFDHPDEKLFMVGITGTNGKTTTSFLIKEILECFIGPSGLLGTIEYMFGARRYPATHTTPDLPSVYKLLAEMCREACKGCVMEVTSHALDQGRVRGIQYDRALFTNLTQDHLDYHKTMETYLAAKAKLFETLSKDAVAILNYDSPYWEHLARKTVANVLTYGTKKGAQVRAEEIELLPGGTQCLVSFKGKAHPFSWALPGRFNVENALAAIALGFSIEMPAELIQKGMKEALAPPGRMERIENDRGVDVFVDFAHTPDALEKALKALQEIKKGRLFVVFGCGGDRDRKKRPMMAKVAQEGSDFAIITSDNPRSEDPEAIILEILKGFENKNSYMIEPDRREAIGRALCMAKKGDIVLIAGKGHENTQCFSHKTVEFDDRLVAGEFLA